MQGSEHKPPGISKRSGGVFDFHRAWNWRGTDPFSSMSKRQEGTRWYLGHKTFTLSDFREESLMTLTPAASRLRGESDVRFVQILSCDPQASQARKAGRFYPVVPAAE